MKGIGPGEAPGTGSHFLTSNAQLHPGQLPTLALSAGKA